MRPHALRGRMSCIFCQIAAGKIPSERVAENARAFAFLDIRPLARGHVLVVPKSHAARVAEMGHEDAAAVMALAQDVARRLDKWTGAAGLTIAVNDGEAAGQEVPHVHVHVVPREEGDGVGPIHRLFAGKEPTLQDGELRALGEKLRA